MACEVEDPGLSAHERRRGLLWLAVCEHRAVVPWVRQGVCRVGRFLQKGTHGKGNRAETERTSTAVGFSGFSVVARGGITGDSTLNRGHAHQRSIRRCSVPAGRPRRFGGVQRARGT